MSLSLLISAWVIGALGGLHCLSMCGGFVAAAGTRDAGLSKPVAILPASTVLARQMAYHGGRIATYMLLGALFGAAGAIAMHTKALAALQQAFYAIANVVLIGLGLRIVLRSLQLRALETAGARMFGAVLPVFQPLLRLPGLSGRVALGLVWGLVPCALVYGVLPLALFAGGSLQGAAMMLAFGIGTTPNLLLLGAFMGRRRKFLEITAVRYAAAAMLIAFGLLGLGRLYYTDGGNVQGQFFCVGPV